MTSLHADFFQADPEGRFPGDDTNIHSEGADLFSQHILHIVIWKLTHITLKHILIFISQLHAITKLFLWPSPLKSQILSHKKVLNSGAFWKIMSVSLTAAKCKTQGYLLFSTELALSPRAFRTYWQKINAPWSSAQSYVTVCKKQTYLITLQHSRAEDGHNGLSLQL